MEAPRSAGRSTSSAAAATAAAAVDGALSLLLQSNFDATSQTCLRTLLKIVDNVISKDDPKVRTLRLSNPTIQQKIVQPQGGIQILQAMGFVYSRIPAAEADRNTDMDMDMDIDGGLDTTTMQHDNNHNSNEYLILPSHVTTTTNNNNNNQMPILVQARRKIHHVLVHELHVVADQLPPMPRPMVIPTTTTTTTTTTNAASGADAFNVYQGRRFDGQSAALLSGGTSTSSSSSFSLGPPPGWKSKTEQELARLTKAQQRLEQQLATSSGAANSNSAPSTSTVQPKKNRDWKAYRSSSTATSGPVSATTAESASWSANTPPATKSDASLLAAHIAKQQAERQASENRGFTTKAMRDLERLQKQKVYQHAHLRIQFPDGSYVTGNFGPKESCAAVVQALCEDVLWLHNEDEDEDDNGPGAVQKYNKDQPPLQLFQTPPRTLLDPKKTLQELQLVPAAKIHVQWKTKPTAPIITATTSNAPPLSPGYFIQPQWFEASSTASTNNNNNNNNNSTSKIPEGVRIVDAARKDEEEEEERKKSKNSREASTAATAAATTTTTTKRKKTRAEKEAALLQRMMGA